MVAEQRLQREAEQQQKARAQYSHAVASQLGVRCFAHANLSERRKEEKKKALFLLPP
jgi:hypothetical protein